MNPALDLHPELDAFAQGLTRLIVRAEGGGWTTAVAGLPDAAADFTAAVVAASPPDETIRRGADDTAFFERWWLVRTPSDGSPGPNRYLHRFLRSDAEEPHCHPWNNGSLVLAGSLTEELWSGPGVMGDKLRRTLKPGDVAIRAAEEVHRIVAVEPGTITLFWTGAKRREWGFWTDAGWIHHRDFRAWKAEREAAAVCDRCHGTGIVRAEAENEWGPSATSWPCERAACTEKRERAETAR